VQHYGYEFKYSDNKVDKQLPLSSGIPEFVTPLLKKMTLQKIVDRQPEQLTVNHYEPGQGNGTLYFKNNVRLAD